MTLEAKMSGKVRIAHDIGDSKETFDLRNKFLRSLGVTPIIALEIARIIQAMKVFVESHPESKELYFSVVHGDKVKWQMIKQAALEEFLQYDIKASVIEMAKKTRDVCIVMARGSEEELSQLGEVANTNLYFSLKPTTVH